MRIQILLQFFIDKLPKGMAKVTHNMTLTRLLRNGLTYSRLISFFESAHNTLDFYDKLKDIGIERKASKSLASHLLTMGYLCRGAIENEQRLEIGETKEDIELNTDVPKNGKYFYEEKRTFDYYYYLTYVLLKIHFLYTPMVQKSSDFY